MISRMMGELTARRNSLKEKEKGFTLIELLVVIVIIGILAAIAIPVYLNVQNNAKDSAVKSNLATIKTAVVAFQTDNNGTLPTDLTGLSKYGYVVQAGDPNYATPGVAPALSTVGTPPTGFAVCAKSVTGNTFGATDASGVVKATLCGSGVLTPAP
jgi:type IV pilus assembly protein PilA